MADAKTFDPSAESSDYCAMKDDWAMIADIRAGARVVKAKKSVYLPQYEEETDGSYLRRLAYTPWRPLFVDALRNICSKPFTKKVHLNEDAPEDIQGKVVDEKTKRREGGWVDDVDGQGNHLHVFARDTFVNGVAQGLAAILVDYPTMAPGLTLADEKAAGAKPYWVQIPVIDIIALYWTKLKGKVVIGHIRIKECVVERDGFDEVRKHRVRVFEMRPDGNGSLAPAWELWEMQRNDATGKDEWVKIGFGPISLPEIPIALYFTGERSGQYRVKPPMIDMAVMQMEIYRAGSRGEEILTYAGSPMLKAVGMTPPQPTRVIDPDTGKPSEAPAPQLKVGPKVILWAPPTMDGVQPDWDYVQPDASILTEIREDKCERAKEFGQLALQPTLPESGNITATAAAIDAAKSHSAVEAWANGLADCLNQALKFTMLWMKRTDTVQVEVHTDFGAGIESVDEARVILEGNKASVVSKKTTREEWKRRGLLGPNFDDQEEEQRLAEEQQGMEGEQEIDPLTGKPIERDPLTGNPLPPQNPPLN